MITTKIKALFKFIEFLNSNIENFNKHSETVNELHQLYSELGRLKPETFFPDRLKFDELSAKIEKNLNVIQSNIIQTIARKAEELNIGDIDRPETVWNRNIIEVYEQIKVATTNDLSVILNHKNKYVAYRNATKGEGFFMLTGFFDYLDRLFKELFGMYDKTTEKDFEAFEKKVMQVNNGSLPLQPIDEPKPELSISQIALKYIYEGKMITRQNGNDIAKEYGRKSGEALYQEYTHYINYGNRVGDANQWSMRKLKEQIKRIERVIELISPDKREQAEDELKILKDIEIKYR